MTSMLVTILRFSSICGSSPTTIMISGPGRTPKGLGAPLPLRTVRFPSHPTTVHEPLPISPNNPAQQPAACNPVPVFFLKSPTDFHFRRIDCGGGENLRYPVSQWCWLFSGTSIGINKQAPESVLKNKVPSLPDDEYDLWARSDPPRASKRPPPPWKTFWAGGQIFGYHSEQRFEDGFGEASYQTTVSDHVSLPLFCVHIFNSLRNRLQALAQHQLEFQASACFPRDSPHRPPFMANQ